jgi:hypothetical protein
MKNEMWRNDFELRKIGYECDILLSVSIEVHEVEIDHDTFSRTSASSTTTFFFLCKYRNSSSNCTIISLKHVRPMGTYGGDKLGTYIGHVLVKRSHEPRVMR